MSERKKRILILSFQQETNTFNPITATFDQFSRTREFEGQGLFAYHTQAGGQVGGAVKAITEAGGEVNPTVFMGAPSGGRVDDAVLNHLCQRMEHYIQNAGEFDAIFAALHGATCTVSHDDACGELLAFLRSLAGDKLIAASFDLHANITEKVLRNADIICGYNTYPHVDHYNTGYRAATLCMERLAGKDFHMAATEIDMLIPPAGYTSLTGPFKALIEKGEAMVKAGQIRDFTVFPVQPWLDIPTITSRVVTIGEDPQTALRCADILSADLLAMRDDAQPELYSVDEIIDIAEQNTTEKPVLLAESADSPNGGCVGDSPIVALRLQERGSELRTCMFVVDPAAVKQAFSMGVGAEGEFIFGAGYTPGMPGPFRGQCQVLSLHNGRFRTGRHAVSYIGPSAVVRFKYVDVLLCTRGASSGMPALFRSCGLDPLDYDLVVVKANTSFRAHYANISDLIYVADTVGAGASNLKQLQWQNLPAGRYPFDLPEGYSPTPAKLW